MERCHIDIFWSHEEGFWIADVPELPFCAAHGATPEEALRELRTVMALWLEGARANGDPVQAPRCRGGTKPRMPDLSQCSPAPRCRGTALDAIESDCERSPSGLTLH